MHGVQACNPVQLTQWTGWSSCTPTCDGGLSTITRTREPKAACASTFVESEDANCGALSCASEVDGSVGLEGVSLEQMTKVDSSTGEQPLISALKATFASAAGVLVQQVTITSITASRRVGIQVSFKISISTDTLGSSAITSLSSAASTGGLAAQFTSNAAERGKVISVAASLTSITQVIFNTAPTVSEAEYGFWTAVFLCLGLLIVAVWYSIATDMLRVRRALAEKDSQQVHEELQINATLDQESGVTVDSEELTDLYLIDPCGQDMQQVFMKCG